MLRLELSSTPECGTLVRALLMGIGNALAWDAELVEDLKIAVTEACNNVVLHAYGDGVGKLVVRLQTQDEGIEVVVCDEGEGFHGVAAGDDHLHVGLPVIGSLAERAEFMSPAEGGTQVCMFFRPGRGSANQTNERVQGVQGSGPDQATIDETLENWTSESVVELVKHEPLLAGDLVGVISPAWLLGPALGRLLRALAAGNHFRLDRFSELRELTDILGDHARAASSARRLAFALGAGERRLEVVSGPFVPGSGSELAGDGSASPPSPLRDLAEELAVENGRHGEFVRLVVSDPR